MDTEKNRGDVPSGSCNVALRCQVLIAIWTLGIHKADIHLEVKAKGKSNATAGGVAYFF